ncbi:MAG TPA: site-2 protease family protein [Acidimicrobiales bacterium]|nr:site-2 protease family protein [Acidimicrobiales bacterium]
MEADSIRIGRIAGVPVGLSWSLLIIAGVFTFGLAEGRFPAAQPAYSAGEHWVAAAITVVLFFGSILAHELAHAVVARRAGLPVEGITLWLLGGVARLGGEASGPGAEARIAAAGPLASLAAAGVFAVGGWALDTVGASALAATTLWWLALINAVLAVFNLLPAAPLDGGRVLAAVLWWRTGDRTRSTLRAATAGRVLGSALIALGVVELFLRDQPFGLWTAFVGWFLVQSATTEARSATARDALRRLTAADIAPQPAVVVDEWLTVDGLTALMGQSGATAFGVRGADGVVRCIVGLDDVRRVPPARRGSTRLEEIAVPIAELTTAWADDSALTVVERLPDKGRGEVAVYDRDLQLVGVIGRGDLARAAAHPPAPAEHAG